MSQIILDAVEKVYPGGVRAVKDASLVVEDGEFVTIVGPSGCGKTTTLRTLAGFEQPTSGTVGLGGIEVSGVPPNERDTGMVFQDFALFPHMTVGENIAFGLTVGGDWPGDEVDTRIEEMLELVELSGFRDRMPDQLSGGQQQRIALARALAPEPEVLLLDEPLASLDKQLRESMQVELRRIQEQIGITTILVTHNQTEALTMSDRVAVMNDGRFEQVGAPTEVYQQPATKFVADFIGTANVFDGTVRNVSDSRVTVDCDGVEFEAAAPDYVAVGDSVTVVTRPEHTVVEPGDTRTNVFEGDVSVSRFLGDHHECHVTLPSGSDVVGVVDSDGPTVSGGDRVSLGVDAKDCLVVVE